MPHAIFGTYLYQVMCVWNLNVTVFYLATLLNTPSTEKMVLNFSSTVRGLYLSDSPETDQRKCKWWRASPKPDQKSTVASVSLAVLDPWLWVRGGHPCGPVQRPMWHRAEASRPLPHVWTWKGASLAPVKPLADCGDQESEPSCKAAPEFLTHWCCSTAGTLSYCSEITCYTAIGTAY